MNTNAKANVNMNLNTNTNANTDADTNASTNTNTNTNTYANTKDANTTDANTKDANTNTNTKDANTNDTNANPYSNVYSDNTVNGLKTSAKSHVNTNANTNENANGPCDTRKQIWNSIQDMSRSDILSLQYNLIPLPDTWLDYSIKSNQFTNSNLIKKIGYILEIQCETRSLLKTMFANIHLGEHYSMIHPSTPFCLNNCVDWTAFHSYLFLFNNFQATL